MTVVLALRHAQSTWNADGRWQGQADPPLSPAGERQVERAAARLPPGIGFDFVVTSDLDRARRTAHLLLEHAAPGRQAARWEVETGLREYDVGWWSGLTRAEIQERWPDQMALFDAGQLAAPPGGESREAFDRRVGEASRRVAAAVHRQRAGMTLIIVHGGVIRSLLRNTGAPERHITHLAGFWGSAEQHGLHLNTPVDLLSAADREERSGPLVL